MKGNYRFEIDGEMILAGPGDTGFAARGSRHTFQNIGTEPSHHIVTVVPGGLDACFRELTVAVPCGSALDPAVVAPLFEKHGLELLGPPLSNSSREIRLTRI